MRKFVAVMLLIFGLMPFAAKADEKGTIDAVNKAAAALDEAFERQDAKAIEQLTTPDHIAVTPYYDAPRDVAEQVKSLAALKYSQTNLDEPTVTVLGPGVAMRRFRADLKGTYKGHPIPTPVYVTSLMVEREGRWREAFYQVTAFSPPEH